MFSYYCTRDKYQPNLISQGTGPTIANLIPYIGADRSNHLPSELWEEAAGTSDHTCPSFDVLPGVWTTPGEIIPRSRELSKHDSQRSLHK